MKNPWPVVRYVVFAAVLSGLAAVLLGGLVAHIVRVRVHRAFAEEAAALRQTPFAGLVPSNARPYRPPASFYEDLRNISVPDSTSTADEKQALRRIETELEHSQAPVFRVTWQRLVPGRSPQTCDFTYFRSDQRVAYRVAGQPERRCAGVRYADFKGMTHGVGSSIAQDITLTQRNRRASLRVHLYQE